MFVVRVWFLLDPRIAARLPSYSLEDPDTQVQEDRPELGGIESLA